MALPLPAVQYLQRVQRSPNQKFYPPCPHDKSLAMRSEIWLKKKKKGVSHCSETVCKHKLTFCCLTHNLTHRFLTHSAKVLAWAFVKVWRIVSTVDWLFFGDGELCRHLFWQAMRSWLSLLLVNTPPSTPHLRSEPSEEHFKNPSWPY